MSRDSRSSRGIAPLVLSLALAFGGGMVPGGTALGTQTAPSTATGDGPVASEQASIREILRDPLWQLTSTRLSPESRQRLLAGLVTEGRTAGSAIAVSIELAAPATRALIGALAAGGARLVNVAGRSIEAYVAADHLATIAGLDLVRAIRPIRRPASTGYVSPAVALHGSSTWQAAGLTGTGVKVGIIDGGFSGIAARLGTELPATVHAHCYTAVGSFTTALADCANGETHGTAVAEAIFDMAPGMDLYVADPISRIDEQRAVNWMTGSGVRIINASFLSGLIFDGPGDGTSPYSNSLYGLVDQAVAGGALWVNAAGNAGDSGWTGPWADANSDNWLDFAPGDETDTMTLAAGADVAVAIRWADPWGASTNNYDLYLYSGSTRVASSRDVQAGFGDPFEVIEYVAPASGTYDIKIRRVSGAPTARMQLLVGTSDDIQLSHQVAAGTLPTPADSANPGMIAVGAVGIDAPTEIEPYSSQGPTVDGRMKPDLVAVDCARTTIIDPFCGTSEAAPFVAGAAAQVLQAHPALTPAQLAEWLRSHADPLGDPAPNSTFGAGRLDLGPLPFEPAAGLVFAWPTTGAVAGAPLTGQPAVRLVDSTGLVLETGPASTSNVTISLATNPTGATLSCPGGLTRAATAGVAVFAGCAIDQPGTGYMIQAAADGLAPVSSPPFDVLGTGSPLPLTLGADPPTITAGTATTLTARFGPAPLTAGRALEIERSVDGVRWSSSGSWAADEAGSLLLSAAPTVTGWYRARFAGSGDLPAATSYPVRVLVRLSIVLAESVRPPRTIGRRTSVTFTSTVRPAGAGLPRATVLYVVYRHVGTVWRVYRRVSVAADASGRARLAWRFSIAGSWYVRSSALATASNGTSALSAIARYTVR